MMMGGDVSPRKQMAMGMKHGGAAHSKKKSVMKKRGGGMAMGMKHGGVAHSKKK
jgi:hypothetical protein